MTAPGAFWLEQGRVAIQGAWFGAFGLALGATLWAMRRPRGDGGAPLARRAWALAMAMLVAMWLIGAGGEMMRRAASVSGLQLLVAMGAFSLLVAGVLSLSREWFGATLDSPLRADKIALSPLVLTFAGWWFGGIALAVNPLWNLAPGGLNSGQRMPPAWALLLGGATLLGASRSVASTDEEFLRVRNPRAATWWLIGVTLLLGWAREAGAASTLAVAGAAFGLKVWRVRRDCPRWLRAPNLFAPQLLRMALVMPALAMAAVLPWFLSGETRAGWAARVAPAWHEPTQLAAWALLSVASLGLWSAFRPALREAIARRFFDRALLQGAWAGFGTASLLVGPGGAVFWAFWPLCGVFFDLLAAREPNRSSLAAQLHARELARTETAP